MYPETPMDEELQEPYKLPHGIQELNRLDVQHSMWTLMIGGLYPSELEFVVQRLMATTQPKIMDAEWYRAIEMAERFPKAQVVGVDIVPINHRSMPPNFIFKQHNLLEGLPDEYSDHFDIIHCRCVCQHMRDPQRLVNDVVRSVKPGGLLLVPDGEWIGFDEDRIALQPFAYCHNLSAEENIEKIRKYSAYAGWLDLFGKVTRSAKYQLPNILLKNTGKVSDIIFKEFWAPTGWAGKDVINGGEIGDITRLNMKEFFGTSSEIIKNQNIPLPIVEAWRSRATEELDERRHNVWYYTSAIALGPQFD